MRVEEILDFDDYWLDERFRLKRPNLQGSRMQAFGDNIYHRSPQTGFWIQENSHHCHEDGTPNRGNIIKDTGRTTNVLVSRIFTYWGDAAPLIPPRFRDYDGLDVCAGRFDRVNFPDRLVADFTDWMTSSGEMGLVGRPADWPHRL